MKAWCPSMWSDYQSTGRYRYDYQSGLCSCRDWWIGVLPDRSRLQDCQNLSALGRNRTVQCFCCCKSELLPPSLRFHPQLLNFFDLIQAWQFQQPLCYHSRCWVRWLPAPTSWSTPPFCRNFSMSDSAGCRRWCSRPLRMLMSQSNTRKSTHHWSLQMYGFPMRVRSQMLVWI